MKTVRHQIAGFLFFLGVFFPVITTNALGEPVALNGMIYVPAGSFLMGSTPSNQLGMMDAGVDEVPQHKVSLKAYWIDRYEVTVAEYRKFVNATGHEPPRIWSMADSPPNSGSQPVIDVSWFDAEAYCRWAGKRLPTEAEWEKAARGTKGQIWPWGNSTDFQKANTLAAKKTGPAAVGSFQKDVSPYEVYDMAGNVMEWTDSWYEAYPGSSLERIAFGKKYRVMKGGAWNAPPLPFSRAANRHAVAPQWDHPSHGFRCAKDP